MKLPILLVLLGIGGSAVPAFAQSSGAGGPSSGSSDGHSAFRASIGVGYGSVGLTCVDCGTTRDGSVAGMLRLGGAVRSTLVLSGQLTGWSKTKRDGKASGGLLSFVTSWYPQRQGFFVEGGIGVASMDATADVPGYGSAEARTASLGL